MSTQIVQQRSDAWRAIRLGLLTGSEWWKLMTSPKSITPESPLSVGAITYIEERFWELADGEAKEIKAWTLDYGIKNEPVAKQILSQYLGQPVADAQFIKHPDGYYGCSPDAMPILYDGAMHSVEIKCPATGRSHDDNIEMCKAHKSEITNEDKPTMWLDSVLLKKYPELFWQTQGHMMMQETRKCIFVSYHDTDKGLRLSTDFIFYIFNRRDEAIDMLKMQLSKAWAYYKSYAAKHGVNMNKVYGIVVASTGPVPHHTPTAEPAPLPATDPTPPTPTEPAKKPRQSKEQKNAAWLKEIEDHCKLLETATDVAQIDGMRAGISPELQKATVMTYSQLRDKLKVAPVASVTAPAPVAVTETIDASGNLTAITGTIPVEPAPVVAPTAPATPADPADPKEQIYTHLKAIAAIPVERDQVSDQISDNDNQMRAFIEYRPHIAKYLRKQNSDKSPNPDFDEKLLQHVTQMNTDLEWDLKGYAARHPHQPAKMV